MAGRIGEIHRILSFTIKLRDGNDRKSLQAELEEIIQQVPSKRAEVISTADGLLVSGEDELERPWFLIALQRARIFDLLGAGFEAVADGWKIVLRQILPPR